MTDRDGGYSREIALMLHGFGDAATPLPATVAVVESAVRRQLRAALADARANAERRGVPRASADDFAFLMRRDPRKLRRLLRHLRLKERCRRVAADAASVDEPNVEPRSRAFTEVLHAANAIGIVDASVDDEDALDEVLAARCARADRVSRRLSADEYAAYHRARAVSFGTGRVNGGGDRLRHWLCARDEPEPTATALEVLAYLAFESVARLVDLTLLVRRSRTCGGEDAVSRAAADGCNPATWEGGACYALTAAQVREALRRLTTPRLGIDGLFSRTVAPDAPQRYLAL